MSDASVTNGHWRVKLPEIKSSELRATFGVDESGFLSGYGRSGGSGETFRNVQKALHAVVKGRPKRRGGRLLYCQCLPDPKTELQRAIQIRRVAGQYRLARNPHTGPAHARSCLFYCDEGPFSAGHRLTAKVVKKTANGDLAVRLRPSLDRRAQRSAPLNSSRARQSESYRRPPITAGGLLHLLFENAHINEWSPHRARPSSNVDTLLRVRASAKNIRLGRSRASDRIAVAGSSGARAMIAKWADESARGIVLAALHEVDFCGNLAKFRVNIDGVTLDADVGIEAQLLRSFPRIFRRSAKCRPRAVRIIALLNCSFRSAIGEDGNRNILATVEDAAFALAEPTYLIPVESHYELKFAQYLMTQKRCFRKPLRYEAGTEFYPDFILTDASSDGDFPCEVFGLTTPEYRERVRWKKEYLNKRYGPDGWLAWDAANRAALPPLPPKMAT